MAASIHHNRCSARTWKIEVSKINGLPTWIQISHHDMKYLPGLSRIALGNHWLRAAPRVVLVISIRPSDCWQAGASAANQSGLLGDGEPRIKRPIGNLSC